MFKNKSESGQNNICGKRIRDLRLRQIPRMSQRLLAARLQLLGFDLDKNAVQRIECGKRFVTDMELKAFAKTFGTTCDALLE